jgi:hypothetical protein
MATSSGSPRPRSKIFNDAVHGHVDIHGLCVKIIDTPEFQRLRDLKQLGGVYLVFPMASHNRFEHSIGVSFLAGKFAEQLSENQPELGITEQEIICCKVCTCVCECVWLRPLGVGHTGGDSWLEAKVQPFFSVLFARM